MREEKKSEECAPRVGVSESFTLMAVTKADETVEKLDVHLVDVWVVGKVVVLAAMTVAA